VTWLNDEEFTKRLVKKMEVRELLNKKYEFPVRFYNVIQVSALKRPLEGDPVWEAKNMS